MHMITRCHYLTISLHTNLNDMNKHIKSIIKNPDLIEQRRKMIIDAANKLFVKKGFHKTKTIEIAQKSGLTEGTIYNYIRKKEDILFLLSRKPSKKSSSKPSIRGLRKAMIFRAKRKNVFNKILDLIEKYQETYRLIYIETASQTRVSLKVLLSGESEIIKKFSDLIAVGVKQKVFNVENPRLVASIIHFLIFYQSLNGWDIKKMQVTALDVKKQVLMSIYRLLDFNKETMAG